jgi:hypothetical protein
MFGDSDALVLSLAQRRRQRYQEWEAAVEQQVERREGAYRVVVLEIGCGARVPSISDEAMCVHRDINAISSRFGAAPAATLVRINPAADCPSHVQGSVVGIQGGAQEVRSRHNLFLFCRQSARLTRAAGAAAAVPQDASHEIVAMRIDACASQRWSARGLVMACLSAAAVEICRRARST